MTVQELIEQLSEYPYPHAQVYIEMPEKMYEVETETPSITSFQYGERFYIKPVEE